MILLWGTRESRKRIGYVADFCPICIDVTPFELWALGVRSHVYYISLSQQSTLDHVRRCCECGVELKSVLSDYLKAERKKIGLDELIRNTHPQVRGKYGEELEIGQSLRRGSLSPTAQQKADFVLEVLRQYNPLVERRYAEWSNFDAQSSTGCLGTLAIVAGLIYFGVSQGSNEISNWAFSAVWYTLLAGLVITFIIAAFGPGRYMRKHIFPKMAKGLKLVRPREDEIHTALERAASFGLRIGKKVKARQMMAALEATSKPIS